MVGVVRGVVVLGEVGVLVGGVVDGVVVEGDVGTLPGGTAGRSGCTVSVMPRTAGPGVEPAPISTGGPVSTSRLCTVVAGLGRVTVHPAPPAAGIHSDQMPSAARPRTSMVAVLPAGTTPTTTLSTCSVARSSRCAGRVSRPVGTGVSAAVSASVSAPPAAAGLSDVAVFDRRPRSAPVLPVSAISVSTPFSSGARNTPFGSSRAVPATIVTPAPSPAERFIDHVDMEPCPRVGAAAVRLDRSLSGSLMATCIIGSTTADGGPMAGGIADGGDVVSEVSSAVDVMSEPARTTAAIVVLSLMADPPVNSCDPWVLWVLWGDQTCSISSGQSTQSKRHEGVRVAVTWSGGDSRRAG